MEKGLETEVNHLEPSLAQWYELLLRRTSLQAQDVVKKLGNLSEEIGIDEVIASIWDALDKKHPLEDKGSEDVMNDLMNGPPLSLDDLNTLSQFVADCSVAVHMFNKAPSLKNQYDTENTLICIKDE